MGRVILIAALLLAPFKALAIELDIIVARGDDTIELFISTRADTFIDAFAFDPLLLAEPDGTVDFDNLRLGTFDTADILFANVEARVSGAPATLEAMSMMVHPIADKLPFGDPIDGMVAIAVCTVPTPERAPSLSELWGYAGFITYVEDAAGTLQLKLPESAPEMAIRVRDFTNFSFTGGFETTLAPGQTLVIPAPREAWQTGQTGMVWLAALVAALIAFAVVLFGRRRSKSADLQGDDGLAGVAPLKHR